MYRYLGYQGLVFSSSFCSAYRHSILNCGPFPCRKCSISFILYLQIRKRMRIGNIPLIKGTNTDCNFDSRQITQNRFQVRKIRLKHCKQLLRIYLRFGHDSNSYGGTNCARDGPRIRFLHHINNLLQKSTNPDVHILNSARSNGQILVTIATANAGE